MTLIHQHLTPTSLDRLKPIAAILIKWNYADSLDEITSDMRPAKGEKDINDWFCEQPEPLK